MEQRMSWEDAALPDPPTGRGTEATRFPRPPAHGRRPPQPSHRAGRGATRFPDVHVRLPCAGRTTPDANGPGARTACPRRGSAGTVMAPSLSLPRRRRAPGSSPQRGEAGRGAEPCARCSSQPSMPPGGTPPNENGGIEELGSPIFTLAVHAAVPHNAAMNIRLFLGGRSPSQTLPRAGAWGNPVSPHPSPRDYFFHVSKYSASLDP